MYIYDQVPTGDVSLGIGWLDAFGKSRKKKAEQLAEARRLEQEIDKLHAKAAWNGVDRAYRLWLENRTEDKWQVHKKAAKAAEKRGDALSRYRRVTTALSLLKRANGPSDKREELKKEREDLEGQWALVEIRLRRKLRSPIKYPVPHGSMSRGDGRAAFKWASEKLSEKKKFDGLLPVGMLGRFSIDGQAITLEHDCALSQASLAKIRQKGDGSFEIDCEPRPASSELNPPTLIEWRR